MNGNIWTNTDGGTSPQLIQFTPGGDQVSSVPVSESYGDIAWSADGTTLYGLVNDPISLATIDPATGGETRRIPITGMGDSQRDVGLTAQPDGSLLVGDGDPGGIYRLNPNTGAATLFALLPAGLSTAGDYFTLPDGDILALLYRAEDNTYPVYRVSPAGTFTQIGTVPPSLGAAFDGQSYVLAGADGTLYRLNVVPQQASTDPLPVTVIVSTGLPFYGASSRLDASTGCQAQA